MNTLPNGILDFSVYPLKENILSTGKGNNRKGLFVGCRGDSSPAALELLSKMLLAAKFDIHEDALVYWFNDSQPFNFTSLRNMEGFSNALFFGIPPKQAGIHLNAQAYQPIAMAGISYLFSASLDEIIANPALKRPLWDGMKVMFGV